MSNGNGFGIGLNEKDKEHLVNFCKFLGVNTYDCIKTDNNNSSVKINLFDNNIHSDLIKLGFTSDKSYDNNAQVWNNIPDNYKKFFMLGFWDGDGYVSISGEGKNLTGCVSNNYLLIEAFVSYINNIFGENFAKVNMSDGYPRIRLTTNKAKNFLDFLYKDAPICLKRKYETYLKFKLPDKKYNKPYSNIQLLPSGNYFVKKQYKGVSYTIGTYSTIKEAVEKYNEKAEEIGFPKQEYIGEYLRWEDIK